MFAVPGWSVSASALKTQVAESSKSVTNNSTATTANSGEDGTTEKSSKKRKRSNGMSKQKDVNRNNLADLWESVIEGKKKTKKHEKKRQKVNEHVGSQVVEKLESNDGAKKKHDKKQSKAQNHLQAENSQKIGDFTIKEQPKTTTEAAKRIIEDHLGSKPDETKSEEEVEEEPEKPQDRDEGAALKDKRHKKSKKEKKRAKQETLEQFANNSPSSAQVVDPAPPKPTPALKPAPQLTPLQVSMHQKLISARFRHINETLYTKPSAHSLSLFQVNPEMFNEYHEGFRRQVEVWPENPVDSYINNIKTRGMIRVPQHGKARDKKAGESLQVEVTPLPRTGGTSIIADLGCGDAALATALQPMAKKLHLKIHSFDLQSPSPLVTKADIANLPLVDGSVDIAIFCLALMGTNWIDFIEEAFRILRWKGELWIAEIKSRFGRLGGKGKRVEHSVGNRKKNVPENKKEKKRAEEESNDLVAAVEVDGVEDKSGETDVSAFVEVLRKRGFVLKDGDGGVDLKNKMFVKMCFIKGASPIKGKYVPLPKGMEKFGGDTWTKKLNGKFIDEEEECVPSEAGVLKPCVYKLR